MTAIVLGCLNLVLTALVLGHLVLRGRPIKSWFSKKSRLSGIIQVDTPPPLASPRVPAPKFPMVFRPTGEIGGANEVLVSYYRSKADPDADPFIAKHVKKSDQYVDEMGIGYVGESFREKFQSAAIAEVRRRTPGVAKAINRDIVMSSDVMGDDAPDATS